MRIAVVSRSFFPRAVGGMERFASNLAVHLQALGAKVDMVTAAPPAASSDGPWPFRVVELSWPKTCLYAWSYLSFIEAAARYVSTGGYDAVYWNGLGVRRGAGIPALLNVQGLELFKEHRPLARLTSLPLRRSLRREARRMDRVISEGGYLTEEIRRFLEVPRERIVEIPNVVDLEYVERHLAAARKGTPPVDAAPLRLLYVGRLTANKGVDVLLRALRDGPLPADAQVVIVGAGPEATRLHALAAGLPVRFVGEVDERTLFAWYARADGFVFPSLYEGMPTVILEAMAAGLPVIASDIGAVPTMVSPDNGWVVPPGDPTALAAAMRSWAAAGPGERRALGQASQRRVRERFTWQIAAAQTIRVFEEVRAHRR